MKMVLNDFYFFLWRFLESIWPQRRVIFARKQVVVVIYIVIHNF